jgi:hypothetical protein
MKISVLMLMALIFAGCSAQPMTLDQELVSTAVAGAVGAGSGAIFAAARGGRSYPASIGIGAAGMAGFILIYEEIKREAAEENAPPPPPPVNTGTPSSSNPNP